MEQEKKISFWKRVKISIKDFEKYQELATEKQKKAVSYFVKLILLFTVCITIAMTYQFFNLLKKGLDYFDSNISRLVFTENQLSINDNQQIEINNENQMFEKIIIDTGEISEERKNEYLDELRNSSNGFLILKDRILFKNVMLSEPVEYFYKPIAEQYNIVKLEKKDVLNFFSGKNLILLSVIVFSITGVYLFVVYITSSLVDSIILMILGYITAKLVGMRLKWSAIWNMSLYSLTLPIILNLIYIIVNTLTGYTIKYFSVMYTTVSYIYIITAILLIKSDFMRRQLELVKIIEEQQRIKQEIEDEKEEKQTPEEKEKEEDKPRERKEEKKPDLGQEPEGNNV